METKNIIDNIAADVVKNVANLRVCNKEVMDSAYAANAEFSYIGFGSLVNAWVSEFDAHLVGFDLLEATLRSADASSTSTPSKKGKMNFSFWQEWQ